MNRPHDMKGVPVYAGDVLRTWHYRSRRYGRKMYLYHVAIEKDGWLQGVPASALADEKKGDGGRFWLRDDSLTATEIVQGYGPGDTEDFTDRPRKKAAFTGATE